MRVQLLFRVLHVHDYMPIYKHALEAGSFSFPYYDIFCQDPNRRYRVTGELIGRFRRVHVTAFWLTVCSEVDM